MEVTFFVPEQVEDGLFKYAVIMARSGGKWVLCRHRDRQTLEFPGGHREPGETMEETARRELYEETGALEYTLTPVCAYAVGDYGMLYYADITAFEGALHSEIAEIFLREELPQRREEWTYPDIQPYLLAAGHQKGFF